MMAAEMPRIHVAVKSLRFEHLEQIIGIENANFVTPWTIKEFAKTLDEKDVKGVVAMNGPAVFGFMIMRLGRRLVEIENIAVHAAKVRNGIGSYLVDFARIQRPRLRLVVSERNLEALRFFKARGLRATGVLFNHYSDAASGDAIVMESEQ